MSESNQLKHEPRKFKSRKYLLFRSGGFEAVNNLYQKNHVVDKFYYQHFRCPYYTEKVFGKESLTSFALFPTRAFLALRELSKR